MSIVGESLMLRIARIADTTQEQERQWLAEVQEIFRLQFPDVAHQAEQILNVFSGATPEGVSAGLLVALDSKDEVQAFALAFYFPEITYGYLDFMATRPDIHGRGLGGALYEAVRDDMRHRGAKGIFLEAAPDDPKQVTDRDELRRNRARLKFYERYGARPIIDTLYDQPWPGLRGPVPFLLFDPLGRRAALSARDCRRAARALTRVRYPEWISHPHIAKVLASIKHTPVRIRPPRYSPRPVTLVPAAMTTRWPLKVISSPIHKLHHVRERGYVERPARVDVILKSLLGLQSVEVLPAEGHDERSIKAVHSREFVNFLRQACRAVPAGHSVYPYVFPVHRPERMPRDRLIRAGYYCLDTFTPLNPNAYKAARAAVDVALTGADLILGGDRLVYALCRPPGHHAEQRFFGGFCYFNNAAIAAQHLTARGRVAVLDIDYHHGNGTQDIFYRRSDVLTVSIHGHPNFAYPYFSGFADEQGDGNGKGFNLNLPLPETIGDDDYLPALDRAIRVIRRYRPAVLVLALGLDLAKNDPTGTWSITPAGLLAIGQRIAGLDLPTLIIQEGGYNTRTLGQNAVHVILGLGQAV